MLARYALASPATGSSWIRCASASVTRRILANQNDATPVSGRMIRMTIARKTTQTQPESTNGTTTSMSWPSANVGDLNRARGTSASTLLSLSRNLFATTVEDSRCTATFFCAGAASTQLSKPLTRKRISNLADRTPPLASAQSVAATTARSSSRCPTDSSPSGWSRSSSAKYLTLLFGL
jgi:hypothetical protein